MPPVSVSPADTSDGRRTDKSTLAHTRAAVGASATDRSWGWLRRVRWRNAGRLPCLTGGLEARSGASASGCECSISLQPPGKSVKEGWANYPPCPEGVPLFFLLVSVSQTTLFETLLFLSYVSGKEPYALVSTPIASHVSLLDGYHEWGRVSNELAHRRYGMTNPCGQERRW